MKKRAVPEPVAAAADPLAESEVKVVYVVAPAPQQKGGDGYLLLGLLAGAVYGAVTGLLLAPRSGAELRRRLKGAASSGPSPAPADPREALAQVLQYTTPTAAKSARQGDSAPAPRAPGL